MNELSTEVKAKEVHLRAIGNFNVAEQFTYRFMMDVKEIRDKRYYKELGYSSFETYCISAWGTKRDIMDQRIQVASTFNEEDFADYNRRFGHGKSLLLARMDESNREEAIDKGIPTEQGNKTLEEATQKEIAEWKKRAEKSESQLKAEQKERERLEKENEKLVNQEPERIEIIPDDYDEVKGGYEAAKRLRNRYKEENEELRKELSELSDSLKNQKFDDSELRELEVKEERLKNKLNEYNKLYDIQTNLEQIISVIAPKIHSVKTENLNNEFGIIEDFESTLNEVVNLCKKTKEKLPNKNVIEGEIIDEI